MSTSAAAFDVIADRYDELWTTSPIGRAQRDQVWRTIDDLFHPGELVLDLGCGTGEDALHLAQRGVHVRACDASAEMVAVARVRGASAEQLTMEDLGRLDASVDGALSNFGALNCVRDLRGVAVSLARLIRPQGYTALCFLNRTCAWEMAYYASRGRFRTATRRWSGRGVETSLGVQVWYPSAGEIRTAFQPEFELTAAHGIGLFVPPSYVKLPGWAVRAAVRADSLLWNSRWRTWADHMLYIFRRREC